MEKKYLIVGMAVLLGVSLSFFGCDDKPGEAAEPSAAEKAATALAETLGADFAEVSGTTVTLKKNTSISDEVTVEAGVTLAVPSSMTLTVTGKINVAEGAEIEVASGGEYDLKASASGKNEGTVTIKKGAVIRTGADHIITGSGLTVVESTGKVYFSGKTTPFLGTSTDSSVEIVLESGTFSYNNAQYILAGAATLKNWKTVDDWNDLYLPKTGPTLTVKRGGVFTVEADAWLGLTGGFTAFADVPLKGDLNGSGDAPKIVVTGDITMGSANTYHYFYAKDYSGKEGEGSLDSSKFVPKKTYEWTSPVVTGGNFAGWKATS